MADEEKKPRTIGRFSYQVPEEATEGFLEEMYETGVGSPGEMISVILRKRYRARAADRMLERFQADGDPAIPDYAPRPSTPKSAQDKQRTADQS